MLSVGARFENIPYHLLSATFIRQQLAPRGVTLVSLYIKCTFESTGFYCYSVFKHVGLLNVASFFFVLDDYQYSCRDGTHFRIFLSQTFRRVP